MMEYLAILIPLLPLFSFAVIALSVNRLSNGMASGLACTSVFISFVLSVTLFSNIVSTGGVYHAEMFTWFYVGDVPIRFSFLVDQLSIVMLLIITGVGFLIHVHSIAYMKGDDGFNRYFSYLNLFVFFMLLLVMGSNYLIMFIGWEGVGLCSYLLIGFWFKNRAYNQAANKAFIMNRIGDLGLLLGIFLILTHFQSLEYADVLGSSNLDAGICTTITLLLFIGATGKSAQIPLYTWLPDAMAGPTPVSALIHAATMVTAGIYMIARNNILFSMSPVTLQCILVIGLATSLIGALIASLQNDIKKVLAYSTVSQLGLIFFVLGLGAYESGIFHMTTHAFFKALLFLAAGSIIHALHGEQDVRNMGALKKYLPFTHIVFLIGCLAISGVPPFAGFFSKDEILLKAYLAHPAWWAIALLISLLTVFYMFRLYYLVFFGNTRTSPDTLAHIHEAPPQMKWPLIVLAVLSVVGGMINLPELLGGNAWFAHFLSPVIPATSHDAIPHQTEWMLMGLVLLGVSLAIFLAYRAYARKKKVPVGEGLIVSPAQKIIYNKLYIDELYHAVIARPLFALSLLIERVLERSGIDRIVDLVGIVPARVGQQLKRIQTGNVSAYVLFMVVGIILILAFTIVI